MKVYRSSPKDSFQGEDPTPFPGSRYRVCYILTQCLGSGVLTILDESESGE